MQNRDISSLNLVSWHETSIYLIPKANWLNLMIADQLVINCYPKITPVWISPLGGIENWPNYNSGSWRTPWLLAVPCWSSAWVCSGGKWITASEEFFYLFISERHYRIWNNRRGLHLRKAHSGQHLWEWAKEKGEDEPCTFRAQESSLRQSSEGKQDRYAKLPSERRNENVLLWRKPGEIRETQ